ncbi:DUF2934 domain-containing protein [Methylomonas methanica]|uniref:DUF2934 domain-containing protein n=1 Tax=Methylomonas methanica TaxID=421 RepID=A0A177M7A4_METMH|nr:DUF2934 domain-containing protein [Methylomonas methanica]OAI01424.1 hypothetical protein A1332_17825 [Methylomonas methanica]
MAFVKKEKAAAIKNLPQLQAQEITEEPVPPSSLQFAEIAYYKAESRGFAPGYELSDWLEAELELSLT